MIFTIIYGKVKLLFSENIFIMQPHWIVPNPPASPSPTLYIIGLFLAVVCGLLGGFLWIHYRDVAGSGVQSADEHTGIMPPHSRNHSSGGCAGLVLFLIAGSAACLLLGKTDEVQNFLKWTMATDSSYYFPLNYPQKVEEDHPVPHIHFSYPRLSDADWTDNKWTADDVPFLKIRREVDEGIAGGKITRYEDPDMFSQQERMIHHWTDIPGVYRGAYIGGKLAYHKWYHFNASRRFARGIRLDGAGRHPGSQYEIRPSIVAENMYGAVIMMKTFPNPHSYQYSRLMFLLESLGMLTRTYKKAVPDELIVLGKNLTVHRPDDWEVKLMLARMLDTFDDINHQNQALDYAREVVDAKPKWPQAWETLGIAYDSLASEKDMQKTKQKKNLAAALIAYQQCKRLAPIDYGPKFDMEEAIQKISMEQKLHAE